jgi:hypothetical protein
MFLVRRLYAPQSASHEDRYLAFVIALNCKFYLRYSWLRGIREKESRDLYQFLAKMYDVPLVNHFTRNSILKFRFICFPVKEHVNNLKSAIFLAVTLYSFLEFQRRFRGKYCLHVQGKK